jgi:electron transport complex protein RnfG
MGEKKGFLAMAKLGIVLALYAAAACVGLAFVYAGTKEKIESNQKAVMEEALRDLFPGAEFESVRNVVITESRVTLDGDINDSENTGAFAARKDGVLVGMALRTSYDGYGGPIKILVGVGRDGKITGIKILDHSETPGLGANMVKPNFTGQFAGKAVSDAFVAKQDVVAITAATITSDAVSVSVKAAGTAALEWMRNSGGAR